MLGHSDRLDEIEKNLSALESQYKALLEKIDKMVKDLEEINKGLGFLNVLSARLNNINYSIQYLLENEFSKSLSDLSTSIHDELSAYGMGFEDIFANIQKQVEQFGKYMGQITSLFQSDPPVLPPDPSPRSLPYPATPMVGVVPGGGDGSAPPSASMQVPVAGGTGGGVSSARRKKGKR